MDPTAGAGCAVLEIDRRGVITSGNEEVARLTGFVPAELAGRHLSVLCDGAAHFFDSPARPGPKLGSAVVEDGDPLALRSLGDMPVEARVVDQDDCVWTFATEVFLCLAGMPQELWQME